MIISTKAAVVSIVVSTENKVQKQYIVTSPALEFCIVLSFCLGLDLNWSAGSDPDFQA